MEIQKISIEETFKKYTDVIAPGQNITREEFAVYLDYCNKRGFDPLAKDIYIVKRRDYKSGKELMSFQSSIDAIRKRGVQAGDYEGQSGPFWCGDDGLWKDVWLANIPPRAAKVGIWRKGFREPVWAVALFDEYAQKDRQDNLTSFWKRMPANQLAKCAESLAWRKCYPETFQGVYSAEEMAQAANEHADTKLERANIVEAQVIEAEKKFPSPILKNAAIHVENPEDLVFLKQWREHLGTLMLKHPFSPFKDDKQKAAQYTMNETGKGLIELSIKEMEDLEKRFFKAFPETAVNPLEVEKAPAL